MTKQTGVCLHIREKIEQEALDREYESFLEISSAGVEG